MRARSSGVSNGLMTYSFAPTANPSRRSAERPRAVSKITFAPAVRSSTPLVRVVHVDDGFGWGEAAIGAGGAILLVSLGALTGLAVRRRRITPPTPARPAAA